MQFLKRFLLVTCFFFHFKTVEFLKFSTHGRFKKIIDWEEKGSDQRPCESEFLGFIMFLFYFLGSFDLVPSVCFRRRVVVMGRKWRHQSCPILQWLLVMGSSSLWLTLFEICSKILNLPSLCIVLCVILVSRKQFLKRFFLVPCLFFHFKTLDF